LNQREVSLKLGFSHSFLSKCETGERRIDVMEFLQLAELYGKSPEFFLKG
jgi:Helix-turn-helix.